MKEKHYQLIKIKLLLAVVILSIYVIYSHTNIDTDEGYMMVTLGFFGLVAGCVGFFVAIPAYIKARKPKHKDSRKKN